MNTNKVYRSLGLMSGTSLDGIDAALIETDGRGHIKPLDFAFMPYDDYLYARTRACFGAREMSAAVAEVGRDITMQHAALCKQVLARHGDVDVIGFHGQTLTHDPAAGFTWQIGDGALLARETGCAVVNNFRANDVAHGGQGAPLLPLYHNALAENKNIQNVLFLNIGGVSNVTFIGESEAEILAFDCGAGNALMDDYIVARMEKKYDEGGKVAAAGSVDQAFLSDLLSHPFFEAPAPKSLDRDAWNIAAAYGLSTEDGMASLLEFTAQGIYKALAHLPRMPAKIYACGGGRHNTALMQRIANLTAIPVHMIENLGLNGDAIEAEGFGYLAVRHMLNLPLTLPRTTGVGIPLTGGVFFS